jgi:ankyrin repeat protein
MKKSLKASFTVDKRDSLGTTLLMEAARQGTYDRLLQCLNEGSDINAIDYHGNNALMYAIEGRQDGLAAVLVARGIDAGRKNNAGITPLMEACVAGIPEIIERIAQAKPALDVQDKQGNTALMRSCAAGDGWAACRLVDAGADFEKLQNSNESTALTIAQARLPRKDLELFMACVEKRREQQRREMAQNVHEATVLQRDVRPLRPVAFRPKAS